MWGHWSSLRISEGLTYHIREIRDVMEHQSPFVLSVQKIKNMIYYIQYKSSSIKLPRQSEE